MQLREQFIKRRSFYIFEISSALLGDWSPVLVNSCHEIVPNLLALGKWRVCKHKTEFVFSKHDELASCSSSLRGFLAQLYSLCREDKLPHFSELNFVIFHVSVVFINLFVAKFRYLNIYTRDFSLNFYIYFKSVRWKILTFKDTSQDTVSILK